MLIVVGGQCRKIGKSSVIVGLIRALREGRWTAVKVTGHGQERSGGQAGYLIEEETSATPADSGRYLAAGASRSYCVRASGEELRQVVPALLEIVRCSENAIVESTSIVQLLKPDLFLMIVDPTVPDWKDSALEHLEKVDAFVVVERASSREGAWTSPLGKPVFRVQPPSHTEPGLVALVRGRMVQKNDQRASGSRSSKARRSPPGE